MSFEQKPFLILFAVVFVWWLLIRRRERPVVALLLAASLLFYAHNHWFLLPILLAYCVVNWFVAIRTGAVRAAAVVGCSCGVGFNLLGLCYYKYTPLLVQTVADLLPGVLPTHCRRTRSRSGAFLTASRSTRSPASPT